MSAQGTFTVWRLVEAAGIAAFMVMLGLLGYEVWGALGVHTGQAAWIVPGAIFAAILVSDFVSGIFHFLADNFGDETTPVFGPNVIGPFREHHVLPKAMTEHGFVETNGNNCLICLPAQAAVYVFLPAAASPLHAFAVLFLALFFVGIFLTNQFHKWSHVDEPPAAVALLQRLRLILDPVQHDVHHTPPFDRYYCITTGWLNPVLDKLRFFARLEALLRWATNSPRPGDVSA